jgi:signal transduction histidine kinase
MNTLRGRLLGSYVLIIGLCLTIVALALFLILRDNPLPERQTMQRLSDIVRATLPTLNTPDSREDPDALHTTLSEIAEANEIRTLAVSRDGTVLFDSADRLEHGSNLTLRAEGTSFRGQQGRFIEPEGQVWLYVSTPLPGRPPARPEQQGSNAPGEQQPPSSDGSILFAAPRRRLPALAIFGINLLRPLVQAGLIACFASIVLAALISGSVARPLQRIGQASGAIARGDYDHAAPVQGPKEVRNLARAFNDMIARVKQSQETQRDFLANVSHELKTPLTSIQGFSQAILDGAESDPARAARVIHDEAGRMRRMVEELLDLARIESGQVVMARQHIDLTAILNAVAERLSLRAAEKGVNLVTTVPALPNLTGDGDRLAQVFTNLIDNALDHTPQGGKVTVSAAQVDGNVHVAVSDTGDGIPAEDLSRIFERFYQVDKSRARASEGVRHGAGLGLTITREIVEAHGGVIRAESAAGHGATFRVWLPLPRSDDATVARPRRRR